MVFLEIPDFNVEINLTCITMIEEEQYPPSLASESVGLVIHFNGTAQSLSLPGWSLKKFTDFRNAAIVKMMRQQQLMQK